MKLILASASPNRLELLRKINIIPDSIISADIDETPATKELPNKLALRLAQEKGQRVLDVTQGDCYIISADTVVALGRRILPKALTQEDVRYCVNLLSGRGHKVYTAFTLIKRINNEVTIRNKVVTTVLKFKRMTTQEIDYYVNINEGLNKAGGYAIQGYAQCYLEFISGSVSNVVGLPLFEVRNGLLSLGYKDIN
jgi:septum formation protein